MAMRPKRLAMRPKETSMANNPPSSVSLTISLPEIYAALCPACQEAFLALLESKASGGVLRESLRKQLDPSSPQAAGFIPQTE